MSKEIMIAWKDIQEYAATLNKRQKEKLAVELFKFIEWMNLRGK